MEDQGKKDPVNLFKLFFSNCEEDEVLQKKINDLVPPIIYIYDANNRKLSYVNKRITDILGFEFDEINNWDDHLSSLVFKDDADFVRKELEKFKSLKDDETYSYNSRLNHKKDNWKYFRTTGRVLKRNETGAPATFLFIAEDITSSIKSEEEINAWKELTCETEDLLQFGTWSQETIDGRIKWSDGLYKLFGYATGEQRDEIYTELLLKHASSNDAGTLGEKINTSFENKAAFEHIYTVTTKTAQEKIVSTKGKPIISPEGALIKFIGTTRDVTEQINAYRELYKHKEITLERERYLDSGSWELDVPTGRLTWSEGMYRLFGYEPPASTSSQSLTLDFFYSHQSQAGAERSKLEMVKILMREKNYVYEEMITAADGKIKRLETFGKTIRNTDNIAVKVMGITKDVTQLKEYEWELERRMAELERSNKELEEFAYIASHDLQEPLRKISTFGNRISLGGDMNGENKAYLTRMLAAADNMKTLINNLLEFSRVTQKPQDYERTDLNKLLEEVKAELELEAGEPGAIINSGTLPSIDVIPPQIKQLFTNILINAVKFRKPGQAAEINITNARVTEEEKQRHGLHKDIEYVKISISDNGIGFEQEYADKIFKLFQRLHGKAEYPGTGLGLAICKKITDNHLGVLYATGRPGEGSTFAVILPAINKN